MANAPAARCIFRFVSSCLYIFLYHTFPFARMRLRALAPRVHSPLSLERFSHTLQQMRLLRRHRLFSLFITRCAGAIFLLQALSVFAFFSLQKEKLRC
jgi:hypothetical protein